MNKYRTHNCAELTEKNTGDIVSLSGWLHRKSQEFVIHRFAR